MKLHLPTEPLRREITRLIPTLVRPTQYEAADIAGVSRRTICRVFEYDEIPYKMADRLCCDLLRKHPWEVYGEEWWEAR